MPDLKKRKIKYSDAINEAIQISMHENKKSICIGLGVDDPKSIFNTTKNLKKIFGEERVFDTPTSENALTGIAIGASLADYSVILTHQRLDFSLLSFDQIINSAAKWFFMFGGKKNVQITIRLIVGRGWGQGPTHSQSLQSLFAHIPGLKVVMPSTPYDAKGLLIQSIRDKNPVIFIEHRWLHHQIGYVPKKKYTIPISLPNILNKGFNVTIVSMSYMTIEAIEAVKILKESKITCDLIDLRTINPLNFKKIFNSVKKTGNLIVLDTSNSSFSVASEIISQVCIKCMNYLKNNPVKIALPDIPTPTSYQLTKKFYPGKIEIINAVSKLTKIKIKDKDMITRNKHHDVPGEWFKGPF